MINNLQAMKEGIQSLGWITMVSCVPAYCACKCSMYVLLVYHNVCIIKCYSAYLIVNPH